MTNTNKLKLDKIDSLDSGIQVAHMTLEITCVSTAFTYEYCKSVKLSSTGLSLRINTSLLTDEIYHLMKWLDKTEDEIGSNETKIKLFAKEMINANEKLKNIKSF